MLTYLLNCIGKLVEMFLYSKYFDVLVYLSLKKSEYQTRLNWFRLPTLVNAHTSLTNKLIRKDVTFSFGAWGGTGSGRAGFYLTNMIESVKSSYVSSEDFYWKTFAIDKKKLFSEVVFLIPYLTYSETHLTKLKGNYFMLKIVK